MGKIVKYLWESKLAVIGIFLLLLIQANCDLALPQYTSNIVNVGIQQGGIQNVAPQEMRAETMDNICLFMSDQDEATVKAAYKQNSAGNYVLNTKDTKTIDKLDQIIGLPLVVIAEGQKSGQLNLEQVQAGLKAGVVTKDQLISQADQAKEKLGDMADTMITQQAITVVKSEYQALGWNMGDYQNNYIVKAGGFMLLVSLMSMLTSTCVTFLAARVAARTGMTLRGRIFKKVISFSHGEMDRFSTASLITRSTNDIQQIQMTSVMLLRMVFYAPILGIGGVIKVMGMEHSMSWIIAVGVGAVMVLVGVLMVVAMPKFKKMQSLVDQVNLIAREILTGIPVIRAFSREKHEEERFDVANKTLTANQLFTTRAMMVMMPLMMFIMNGISVLIVWVGAHGINDGIIQVGDMMAFISYAIQIIMSFLMLSMVSILLPRAGVAADRIAEVLAVEPEIVDAPQTKDDQLSDVKGVLSFEDVSFHYPHAEEDALEHISFTAEPGKTTAIIGSTGSGKTTLLHMIPRFYDATGGRICLDGIDIRDISQSKLRSLLGFVPQKGVLFSGTIASNIKFGADDLSDQGMEEAAAVAQATEFVEGKPEKYQSSIAQGGTNVSGGQKQRLSIARAIAVHPKLFLFDDSFSALDYKTDATLRGALKAYTADATVIIVAQRISTILHADQILVLDDGKIVGQGTHAELLETCEPYQEIATSQLSEEELKGGRS